MSKVAILLDKVTLLRTSHPVGKALLLGSNSIEIPHSTMTYLPFWPYNTADKPVRVNSTGQGDLR